MNSFPGTRPSRADDQGLSPPQLDLVGNLIRSARVRGGWSLERLAAACGSSQSMLTRVEQGQRLMSRPSLLRVAEALGLNPALTDYIMAQCQYLPPSLAGATVADYRTIREAMIKYNRLEADRDA